MNLLDLIHISHFQREPNLTLKISLLRHIFSKYTSKTNLKMDYRDTTFNTIFAI